MMDNAGKDRLYRDLFDAGCVKFGDFKLKSGIMSPVYIDLRGLVGFPWLLQDVGEAIADAVEELPADRIAGIPYAGLPIGCAVSFQSRIPMIYPRKEVKDYGTAKVIEGPFNEGEIVVVVDDIITDGASKIEAIEPLLAAGLKVKNIVVLIDREQGAAAKLTQEGFVLHSIGTLSQVLESLVQQGKVTTAKKIEVTEYIAKNQLV